MHSHLQGTLGRHAGPPGCRGRRQLPLRLQRWVVASVDTETPDPRPWVLPANQLAAYQAKGTNVGAHRQGIDRRSERVEDKLPGPETSETPARS
jgi:hypothetical protein